MAYKEIIDKLGDQDPIEVLTLTPSKLELYLASFSDSDYERSYALKKWSARQVLAHLADAEVIFSYRLRQTIHQKKHHVQLVDQIAWARDYKRLEPSLAVDSLRALRMWNLAFFTTLTLEDWLKESLHPEHGIISVDAFIKYWAGHDLNHLSQLDIIAQTKSLN